VLATTSAAAVVSESAVTRYLRTRQAEEVGRRWISLVLDGDTKSAFQLTSGNPPPDPRRPEEFGPGGNPYRRFLELNTVKALQAAGAASTVEDLGTIRYSSQGKGEFLIRQRYRVTPGGDRSADMADRGPFFIVLQLHRRQPPEATYLAWLAEPVELDPEIGASGP
jgi:hypothetical protein